MEQRRREPAPGVFRLVLPLPFPGLKHVNAYLLSDPDGSTLVDCGIHDPEPARDHGWEDLVGALDACGTALESIARLVVTHPHIDHYGLAARVVEETGCELWMHEKAHLDLDAYRSSDGAAQRVRRLLSEQGVEPDELDELTAFEDWRAFVAGIVDPTTWLRGEESFSVGSRTWQIVYTPGHSASHICVWAPEDHLLISGDHLLPTITPHIDFTGVEEDPLGDYLDSLRKVEELDPALVLAGHGRPFDNGAGRARVIQRHHDRRLGSILQVIRHRPRSANEITDEIFGTTLLHFQRRLALGEALAHLVYLRKRGEVELVQEDGAYLYKKASRARPEEDE